MKKQMIFILFMYSLGAQALNQFDAKTLKKPLREIAIIASDDGYFPNRISVFAGEKLKLMVTSIANKKQCLLVQKHDVFLPAEKGKLADKEIVMQKPGRYRFYCPSTKFEGHITVLPVPLKEKKPKAKRDIANIKEEKSYWTPRNYDEK